MTTRKSFDIPAGLEGAYPFALHLPVQYARLATRTLAIFAAFAPSKILRVSLIPMEAVTGQATNTKHLNLINLGTDGAGTAELAARDLVSGTNLAALTPTVLYQPAAPLAVPTGTVLGLQFQKIGTGLLVPEMMIETLYAPQD